MAVPSPTQLSGRLRARVAKGREVMRAALGEGAGGAAACRAFSQVYDELIKALWTDALVQVDGAADAGLALVATGGWGRQEVCPFSDIDFILLAPPRQMARARAVADKLLYPLWDARVDVGHAVRDVKETAKLAGSDLATATALLDARYVVGDESLAVTLGRATRRVIAPGDNANPFVSKLAAEMRSRHERFIDSLYLLEPNLKQGTGALRDLATAGWAARARWDVNTLDELVRLGHASSRRVAVLSQARDFLLGLRSMLHLEAGRPTDQLTFEIQEAIAPRLYPNARLPKGDVRPAVAPAVEALMRRYYLHARGALQATKRLLEVARVPARRRPRIARIDGTFLTFNGKLALHDPAVFVHKPEEMVRLFNVALELDVEIYGHTKELVADRVAGGSATLSQDRLATRHFLDLLVDPRDAVRDALAPSLLEQMHQVGLLGALLPEFAPCTCRVQHDLYHVYTVDQHQLYAVALLKRIARRELAEEYPTATAISATVTRPEPLYLATLLHDVGKPLGKGHAESGARLIANIARRLGFDGNDVERAEFLVRQHLTMSHISQRRDLSDPEVISRFAERVGSEDALVQLYLLTLCDTAMTAPGNLTAWKHQLMRDLFLRTRSAMRGGSEAGAASESVDHVTASVRKRVRALVVSSGEISSPRAEQFLDGLDERFLTSMSPRQLARHARLTVQHRERGRGVELDVAHYPMKGHSEVAMVADDVPGLMAAIAGVFAAHRVNVLGAIVGRLAPAGELPVACDTYFVSDLQGDAIAADDPRWDRIRSTLEELIEGGLIDNGAVSRLVARRRPRTFLEDRVTPGVPTVIKVDNDASAECTVVEVFTRDGVGVLHVIARTLADQGLDIYLAKISTEGEKVGDIFYVTQGQPKRKLVGPGRIAKLRARLETALTEAAEGTA